MFHENKVPVECTGTLFVCNLPLFVKNKNNLCDAGR